MSNKANTSYYEDTYRQRQKNVKRLLKELGLWNAWRKGRIIYLSRLKQHYPDARIIPNVKAFADVLGDSFPWIEQPNSNVWVVLAHTIAKHSRHKSAQDILNDEGLFELIKEVIKNEINNYA